MPLQRFQRFDFNIYFVICKCFEFGPVLQFVIWCRVNSLPNYKILETKLKAFADDKINEAQMMISVFDRVENIAGKGENAGYQHFLLFPQCFQKASSLGSLKVGIVW